MLTNRNRADESKLLCSRVDMNPSARSRTVAASVQCDRNSSSRSTGTSNELMRITLGTLTSSASSCLCTHAGGNSRSAQSSEVVDDYSDSQSLPRPEFREPSTSSTLIEGVLHMHQALREKRTAIDAKENHRSARNRALLYSPAVTVCAARLLLKTVSSGRVRVHSTTIRDRAPAETSMASRSHLASAPETA